MYVCMPQAVGGSRPAFAVEPEILLIQNRLEKFALFRENEVCLLRQAPFFGPVLDGVWSIHVCAHVRACFIGSQGAESGLQSLERAHGAAHALAIAIIYLDSEL